MPATRTQVYLTAEQRRQIDAIAKAEGLTMAEVVRRALDRYLTGDVDPTIALKATFGVSPDGRFPSRDEWERG